MSANTIAPSSNDNLESTTRNLWKKVVVPQVLLRSPVFAKLMTSRQFVWKAGKNITATVDTAETDDTSQFYTVGEGMTATRKTTLDRPYFGRKYLQTPIVMDVDEILDNDGTSEESVIDLAEFLVKKAVRATRIKTIKAMYASGSTDAGSAFQSLYQALEHDTAYGHLTRTIASSTNTWWQGASLGDTYTDQATGRTISVSLIRQCTSKLSEHADNPGDIFYVMGPSLYLTLQAQIDGSIKYRPGPMVKYGFMSFMIDGAEIIMDDYLTDTNLPDETNPDQWLFGLNSADWEVRLHPKRAFTLKPFVWQGDRADSADQELSRVMAAGNLVCWKPRGSILLTAVT
jgi:hypothetical protein